MGLQVALMMMTFRKRQHWNEGLGYESVGTTIDRLEKGRCEVLCVPSTTL